MIKSAKEFYEDGYYQRKPRETKPVLDLVMWGLFEDFGYELACGRMASDGHPYLRKGTYVAHTSVIIDKFTDEDATPAIETHNSVYRLVGPSFNEMAAEKLKENKDE